MSLVLYIIIYIECLHVEFYRCPLGGLIYSCNVSSHCLLLVVLSLVHQHLEG